MKRILANLMLFNLLAASCNQSSNCNKVSTVFIPRSITTDLAYELSLTNNKFYRDNSCKQYQFNVKPFYQQSTKPKCLASYFMINNKTSLQVREDGSGNIDPLWLDVIAPKGDMYSSTLSLRPKRSAYGAVFTFNAYFTECWWLGINTALVTAKHNLNFCESNQLYNGTIPGFSNLSAGFNNKSWTAGRMAPCAVKKTGLDDIQLKFGYDVKKTECSRVSPYLICTIPTGDKPTAKYLFEPLVGSRHFSIGAGLDCDLSLLNRDSDKELKFLFDAKYRYICSAQERRSFDLKANGNWSRYLLVVKHNAVADSLPGINEFTHNVKVTPGSEFQIFAAINKQRCNWSFELGYNFWLRATEKIKNNNKCCVGSTINEYGIFDLSGLNQVTTTGSNANISQAVDGSNAVVSDSTFTYLSLSDLDLKSGIHRQAISNKIYGSIGYDVCRNFLFAVNGSYEFANNINALNQYALWATFGFDF